MTPMVESPRRKWSMVYGLFTRSQPVTVPMIVLFAIIPFYLVIGDLVSGWPVHAPELALDLALPLQPAWSVIYGSLFLAALLPVFVVHQQELIRRTVAAFAYPREATPEFERRLAPVLALAAFGMYGLIVAGLWVLYTLNVEI